MRNDESKARHRLMSPFALCLLAITLTFGLAQPAFADLQTGNTDLSAQSVVLMPDVTEDMTNPLYWSNKQKSPTTVLANRAAIDALNKAGVDADGTGLQPLKDAAERFYTQDEQARLKASIESDLAYFVEQGAQDADGQVLTEAEAAAIAANCPSDGSTPTMPDGSTPIASGYAIVTTHTTMRCLPTDRMIGLTPGDADDDNLYLTALRVNEPLLVRAQSVDKRFYLCISSCLQASWVPAEDIAICHNRAEWLAAWDIPAGQELVVTDYKIYTEQSNVTPNVSNRMLYMGTVLERIDLESPEQALEIVGTRSAYNRHVCYLPVRNDDGSYSKELALIAESADVSEGYLPLTKENISKQAFKSLGQMYGWGGMLEANDCSGYVRDVYKCFGLELARNTTWQMNMPVCTYDLSEMTDEQKLTAIKQMPLGTVLFWGGHEMIYLGHEGDKLYVISSLGGIGDLYGDTYNSYQVKGVTINTLDMVRANRSTWLSTLTCANIPYIPAGAEPQDDVTYEMVAGGGSWTKGSSEGLSFTYERSTEEASTFEHFTGVLIDGQAIAPESYTARSGSVVIELKPSYLETLSTGTHILQPVFDDGEAAAVTFSVQSENSAKTPAATTKSGARASATTPKTGDAIPIMVICLLAVAGLVGVFIARRQLRE